MVVVLGLLLALGLLGILRLARGLTLIPAGMLQLPRRRSSRALSSKEKRTMITGVVVGAVILVATRNLVFAVIAGSAVVLWPMIAGGGKAERAALTKLEALAQWTESLRDLAQKDSGLESVIPKTVDGASDVLVAPLRRMSRSLSVRVPLPEASAGSPTMWMTPSRPGGRRARAGGTPTARAPLTRPLGAVEVVA